MAVPNEMDPMLSIPAAGSSSTNANPDDPSSTSTPNPTTLPPSLSTATAITTQQRNQITAKTLLETPESQRATTLLGTSHDLLLATRDVVSRHASDLEFQVDQLADACHRINMYADVADGLAGKMLETVEKRLAEKERAIRERAGTEGLGTLEILRGLARFSE